MLNAATHDLDVLNALLALDGEAFKSAAADKFYEPALEDLPDFEAADSLPFSTGAALADYYREEGYGFFAQSSAFAMQDDGSATPIVHPDAIRLHDLPGYEMQKQKILKNTLAFLDGRDANNILLYGDKGTGKSSTVKAVCQRVYANRGSKIIEMSPQITNFPSCLSRPCVRRSVSSCSLDLTFSARMTTVALKAFIEAVWRKSRPIWLTTSTAVISSARAWPTVRAMRCACAIPPRPLPRCPTVSVWITFSITDKDEYLYIVEQLAKENDLNLAIDESALCLQSASRCAVTDVRRVPQDSLSASSWRGAVRQAMKWRMIFIFHFCI